LKILRLSGSPKRTRSCADPASRKERGRASLHSRFSFACSSGNEPGEQVRIHVAA
jgi:hypothetical protein